MSDLGAAGRDPRRGHPAQEEVESVCASCVVAAEVDGGGVSILSSDGIPLPFCATSDLAAVVEDLQLTLGQGPCVDALGGAGPILVTDLTDRNEGTAGRWPAFVDEALAAGVHSVFAFPIRIGAINLGTVDLYREVPAPLTERQVSAALTAVDTIGWRLLGLGADQPDGLDGAFHLVVHQAAGMIMGQLETRIEDALTRLRATAYAEGVSINALAADVVNGRRRFTKESP